MKETIIAYHENDKEKKLYNWELCDLLLRTDVMKGNLYAVVESKHEHKIVKVVGLGEVNDDIPLAKAVKVFEMTC